MLDSVQYGVVDLFLCVFGSSVKGHHAWACCTSHCAARASACIAPTTARAGPDGRPLDPPLALDHVTFLWSTKKRMPPGLAPRARPRQHQHNKNPLSKKRIGQKNWSCCLKCGTSPVESSKRRGSRFQSRSHSSRIRSCTTAPPVLLYFCGGEIINYFVRAASACLAVAYVGPLRRFHVEQWRPKWPPPRQTLARSLRGCATRTWP